MEQQDYGPHGHVRNDNHNGCKRFHTPRTPRTASQSISNLPPLDSADNEVIFDNWKYPWEEDIGELVSAIFVQVTASKLSVEYGRQLHQAHLDHTGRLAEEVPLVMYDPRADSEPFQLLSKSQVRCPPKCDI